MSNSFILKLLLLAMSLLLALLPAYEIQAQDKKQHKKTDVEKGPKQLKLKIIRADDGKTTITDTVIIVNELQDVRIMLKDMKMDTTALRMLGDTKVRILHADSLRQHLKHLDKLELLREVDSVRFRNMDPVRLKLSNGDSVGVFRLRKSMAGEAMELADMEHMILERHQSDSVLARELKSRFKVEKDEKTGERKVYRIDENGKATEIIDRLRHTPDGNMRTIIIMREAKVEDISAEDKKALKDAGAPVETKTKEELKVDEINFYPNPNNGRFTLNFTLDKKATTVVRVMDSKGNEVFVDTVEKLEGEYKREIDLSVFGPGIYYLQVAQGKRYHTKKILVQ